MPEPSGIEGYLGHLARRLGGQCGYVRAMEREKGRAPREAYGHALCAAEDLLRELFRRPTPEEVRSRREARRGREEAWGGSYGGSDPGDDERSMR